nr:ParB/RepB/Spo0J family partition protein [Streptacidiphilus jiangxiensis]
MLALFPEPDKDDLQALVDSIKHDGMFQPIVVDSDGLLLDGRARMKACRELGFEPEQVIFEGEDPGGYALTVNLRRRGLTKGQTAMIAAKACSSNEHALRSLDELTARSLSEQAGVSLGGIGQANMVLRFAADLVDSVISGAIGLNEAYKEAKKRKNQASSAEAQLERLRKDDPALANRVVEGELTLAGAVAERAARLEDEARQRQASTQLLCQTVTPLSKTAATDAFHQYDPALAPPEQAVTRERIAQAISALREMDQVWQERGLE